MADAGPDNTFNADHCVINYELHSGRTDEFKGVRHVEALVQSRNALTHSCTYFPMISAAGKLQEKFLLIMQESSSTFGSRVDKTVLRPPNVYLNASRSGKMTKEILHDWVKFVYYDSIEESAVSFLIVDSCSAFKDFAGMNQQIPNGHELISHLIPEGTTSQVQTLDVYRFRIIKAFIKKNY